MNNFTTKQLTVDIEKVVPNKWNPNSQNEKIFAKEILSIKTHGFVQPILVREIADVYEIIDGEHRWRACKEAGYTEIKVESMGYISDEQAKILTINLNNLRGQDDPLKRAEILKSISQGQWQLFPFDEKAIQEEIKLLDFNFDQFADAQLNDNQKDSFTQAMETALKLDKILRNIHSSSNNTKLKLLLEQYFEWFKIIATIENK